MKKQLSSNTYLTNLLSNYWFNVATKKYASELLYDIYKQHFLPSKNIGPYAVKRLEIL